ncbi:MAG: helix-turn-helix domain-containing protein [Christensenellales bacterium]
METKINTDLIRDYMRANNSSKQEFCKSCKISIGVLNKILNGKENFRISALLKISRLINVELYKLFI